MRRLRAQRGVAMITVLLVGAGLTAVSSVAAYSAINELRSANADGRSSKALAYAEAGVDRFITHIRGGTYTFNQMNRAGCTVAGITYPPLTIPTGLVGDEGAYTAEMTVYNPGALTPENRFARNPAVPGDACTPFYPTGVNGGARPTKIIDWPEEGTPPSPTAYFQITATGYVGSVANFSARRVVRQVIRIQPKGLPIGIYGQNLLVGGSARLITISAFSETDVQGRNGVDFEGIDPYYTYEDVFPGGVVCPDLSVCGPTKHVPAAVHAAGTLVFTNNAIEFSTGVPNGGVPPTNCRANKSNSSTQSLWDSDGSSAAGTLTAGCTGQIGRPVHNRFTTADLTRLITKVTEDDYEAMKSNAKANGIYCSLPGFGGTGLAQCQVRGISTGSDFQNGPETLRAAGVKNYIAYFEYRSGTAAQNSGGTRGVPWNDSVGPCSNDPAVHESVTIVIRKGGISVNGGSTNNGAIIMDGSFENANGTGFWNGPVISNSRIDATGNFDFTLNSCWIDNMGGAFIKVTPTQWFEVDR